MSITFSNKHTYNKTFVFHFIMGGISTGIYDHGSKFLMQPTTYLLNKGFAVLGMTFNPDLIAAYASNMSNIIIGIIAVPIMAAGPAFLYFDYLAREEGFSEEKLCEQEKTTMQCESELVS